MRGHIVKRYKGSYSIILSLTDPVTGKRKQQWITVKGTKRDAERKLAELLYQLDTGAFVSPSKLTLAQFLEQWLRDCAKANTSPRTYERYHELVATHIAPALGAMPLSSLKPSHIQAFYGRLLESGRRDGKGGLSAQTVLHIHRLLFQALRFGVRQGMTGRNVCESVVPPRPKFREMPFTTAWVWSSYSKRSKVVSIMH